MYHYYGITILHRYLSCHNRYGYLKTNDQTDIVLNGLMINHCGS